MHISGQRDFPDHAHWLVKSLSGRSRQHTRGIFPTYLTGRLPRRGIWYVVPSPSQESQESLSLSIALMSDSQVIELPLNADQAAQFASILVELLVSKSYT
jgi:hypothetical protein